MDQKYQQLKTLIESSQRILITSHIGPDGDAVASSLLLLDILKTSYPDKQAKVSLEEEPYGLDFLKDLGSIELEPLSDIVSRFKPELLVVLDANTVNRLSRRPEAAREALKQAGSKVVIIDHHEVGTADDYDLLINNQSPAVTLDIYEIFLKELKMTKPDGYAQTALTGIYTDTGGFINRNLNFNKTFAAVPELIADGADLEQIANDLKVISQKGAEVFSELIANTRYENGYTYSFISDELAGNRNNLEAIRQATDLYRSEILRNVEGRPWGFIVYRDVLAPDSTYSASFRAQSGAKDVSNFARALGGGGHKPAAGAKFEARSLEEALQKVQSVIKANQ